MTPPLPPPLMIAALPAAEIGAPDRRRDAGVAVISFRRAWLAQRLLASGVSVRHVVPQLGHPLLPDIRPPLLLDSVSMPPRMLTAILWELRTVRHIPTLALISGDAPGVGRLLALAPAVHVVIADTVPPETLALWLRMAPALAARRLVTASPAWVGVVAPAVPLPAATLAALYALAPYGSEPSASLADAAQRIGVSRRQLCYHLAALRAALGVPPQRRYRPHALAAAICQAIVAPPHG
ncbi:hypothetical protein EKD04_017855 [Chloroflexales bacterium ZM16-3]|nr:hypothetical protein [Chloroflexales bacterium ZM16-3]